MRIIQGFTGAIVVLGTLLGGSVTTTQALGFPGSVIQSSTEGEPAVRNVVGSTPAVGANISETCPSGARWELVTIFCTFFASAQAASRSVFLEIVSGGLIYGVYGPGVVTSAGQSLAFLFAQNIPVFGTVTPGVEYMAVPQRQFLRSGDSFVVGAISLQTLDQFTIPLYQVREWLEVP